MTKRPYFKTATIATGINAQIIIPKNAKLNWVCITQAASASFTIYFSNDDFSSSTPQFDQNNSDKNSTTVYGFKIENLGNLRIYNSSGTNALTYQLFGEEYV